MAAKKPSLPRFSGRRQHGHGRHLGECLDDEHARQHVVLREVAAEHGAHVAHAQTAAGPGALLAVFDAINERKRVTMRQNLRDLIRIELHGNHLAIPLLEQDARVVAAEAERVGQRVLDVGPRGPRWARSPGRTPGRAPRSRWSAAGTDRAGESAVKMASTAPAAPSMWPVMDLVEETAMS